MWYFGLASIVLTLDASNVTLEHKRWSHMGLRTIYGQSKTKHKYLLC